IALFFSRTYARLLRPKLAEIMTADPPGDSSLRAAFDRLQTEIDRCCEEKNSSPENLTHLHYNLLCKDSSREANRVDRVLGSASSHKQNRDRSRKHVRMAEQWTPNVGSKSSTSITPECNSLPNSARLSSMARAPRMRTCGARWNRCLPRLKRMEAFWKPRRWRKRRR